MSNSDKPRNWLHRVADQANPYFEEMTRREYWGLAGLGMIGLGFGWIWFPLALIFVGLSICGLVAVSMLTGRNQSTGGD